MKNIRHGVFETNSSSTHSICIAKDSLLIFPNELHFSFDDFGWEHDTLTSLQSKADYLYTGLISNDRITDFEKIVEKLRSKDITVSFEEPIYKTNEYTGDDGKEYKYTSGVNVGYVDHADRLEKFLDDICSDEQMLMRYLFSEFSFIITGNDNDLDEVEINVSYEHDTYFKGN